MKSFAIWLVIIVVALLGIIGGVVAISGLNSEDVVLGDSGSRFRNGVSADSTSPVAGELRGTTLTITAASAFTGLLTASGGITASGDSHLNSLTQGGAVTAVTVSTTAQTDVPNTLLAAQICDQSYLPITPGNTTTPRLLFPTAAALYADCLTTNGDTKSVYFYNTSGVTSTLFIVNTSGTLMFASTTNLGTNATLMAGDGAMVTFVRTALATMQILINQFSP